MKGFLAFGVGVLLSSLSFGQQYFTGFEATESAPWTAGSTSSPWGTVSNPFGVVTTATAVNRTPLYTSTEGSQALTISQNTGTVTPFLISTPQFNPGSTSNVGFAKISIKWRQYIDSANTGSSRFFGFQTRGYESRWMMNDSGVVVANNAVGPNFFTTTLTNVVDRWVDMAIHFNAETGTLTGEVNGALYLLKSDVPSTARVYQFSLVSTSASSTNGTGRAYFDSVQVVPEPASMAAIAVGVLGLIARRGKKNN